MATDDDAYTVQPVGHFYRALKYRKDTMKDIEVLALKGEDYMRRIYNHKLILKDVATKKIGISVCMKRGTYHTIPYHGCTLCNTERPQDLKRQR